MAVRPFWRGYLKLSLVTCAVTLMPATSASERLHFHTMNRKTGNRVRSRYVDAVTQAPVEEDDQVKGYPRGDDDFVLLEDEEIEAVALETTHTIDIERFVPRRSVGWIWYDAPHFLAPADEVGEEAFSVIRQAMAEKEVAGLSRLVLYRRERAVLIEPRDQGLVLWTLRYADEVRDDHDLPTPPEETLPKDWTEMIGRLIAARTQDWTPDLVGDPVQKELKSIIAAKAKAKAPAAKRKPVSDEPKGDNVIDIMDALKRSLKPKG